MKNFLCTLALSVFCFAAVNFGQEGKSAGKQYEFKGVVKTADGSVFAGIPLFFKNGEKEDFVSTDINGEFSIMLPPGNYEVTVRKTLSETFKANVVIRKNGSKPKRVKFVVEPNAVCCGDSTEKSYPKVTRLVKPPYPAAAQAVRANGEVVVEVKIDKEGKVIEAKAISGHPLLRQISFVAAKSTLFEASASGATREAKLTFVFLLEQPEKANIKRYTNPYRVEIVRIFEILDTQNVE